MVYLHGHNIVPEEIEGIPARTSLPRFVSPDPKHGDTQSDAVNDGASSSDTMRIHPSIQAYTINSPVEFHITPGSSQVKPARAASSQQEQIADSSTLGHENISGRLPQAADAPFDPFAKQHGLVMEMTKKVPGDMYPDTLSSMANLASTYWNQGRWGDAEKLQVEVMKTSQRVLGDEHPDTLTSMHNLALTYWNQGRWGKAKKLQVEVMKTRKRVLGDQHPSTLSSMNNLASTYWNQRRWEEAEKLEVEVMKTSKKVLGDEHPDTLTSMHNLAYTLRSQSRHIEALALIEICFQSRRNVLSKQHPDTQSSLEALNRWRGDAHDEW
jgi:tetratricopeptide (TPR) repeat protein